MIVIAVSGYGRAGKDTIGTFLRAQGFKRYAFAERLLEFLFQQDPIVAFNVQAGRPVRFKELHDRMGYEGAKEYEEFTKLLQRTGTEAGRMVIGEDVWANALAKLIEEEKPERAVITDLRFINEAQMVIKRLKGECWRVNRPGNGPKTDSEGNVHHSETSLDHFTGFTEVITNDGELNDLRKKVNDILSERGLI